MRCRLVFILAHLCFCFELLAEPAVRFTLARPSTGQSSLRFVGNIEAPKTSTLANEVAGVVDRLLVQEGASVQRGQPILYLRRDGLELSHRAASGQLAEAQARLKAATGRAERMRELATSEVVSQQVADDANHEVQALGGRVAQLEAELARLHRDLENCTLRASFAGVVGSLYVQPGEWIAMGDPVVELISLDHLEARVQVPERHFAKLKQGTSARITVDAMPGLAVAGRIRVVVPKIDAASRTFPVLVELPKSQPGIGIGMFVQVDFKVAAAHATSLVPKDAVIDLGSKKVLYVLEEDSSVKQVAVQVATGMDTWVSVQGEVHSGDAVVIRGNEWLQDGQKVQGQLLEYPLGGIGGSP